MKDQIEIIKELRKKTGAPIVDCKKVFLECKEDIKKAEEKLIEKGFNTAKKKEGRAILQGGITSYVHHNATMGVLVEINCETDFVAITAEFKEFGKSVAMQIAATAPCYITREDVPDTALTDVPESKKEDFYKANCLIEQACVKDSSKTIKDLLTSVIAKTGENIKIRKFVRYEVGK
jgi:elongation factor Ts